MLRVDMTEADHRRAYDSYWACLESHGVRMISKGRGAEKVPAEESKDNRGGYAACEDKEPYPDPLLDKARPDYPDQTRAWMKCMNDRGIEVSGNWDDEFFTFGERAPGIDGKEYLAIYRECQVQSYRW